jgi:aspartokinase/homoserine dehydrogenase 1
VTFGHGCGYKLIILAREMGCAWNVATSLIQPRANCRWFIEEFLDGLTKHDAAMKQRYLQAAAGKVLRFVGRITAGAGNGRRRRAGSQALFTNIALTDNVVRFATARYCNNPLIVQAGRGPGSPRAACLRISAFVRVPRARVAISL